MAQAMNGDFRQMPENTILIQFADPDKVFPSVPGVSLKYINSNVGM